MHNLKSTFSVYPQCVDARNLRMDVDFFLINREQITELLCEFVKWCSTLDASLILSWECNGRRTNCNRIIDATVKNPDIDFGFVGAVSSEIIKSKQALNKCIREINHLMPEIYTTDISLDYVDFYRFQKQRLINGEIAWKDFILSFFNEPTRRCFATAPIPDIQGCAICLPYSRGDNLFHGSLSVTFCVYSLGEAVSYFAEKMACFLVQQAEIYKNINGNISVTPITYPSCGRGHMHYFENCATIDGSHNEIELEPREWYPYYYICGAEWFNLISPLARERIPNLLHDATQYDTLQIHELQNKGVVVRVNQSPDQIDVQDLTPVKCLLYEGLFPGMSQFLKDDLLNEKDFFSFRGKPRRLWECVPVFEDEVVVAEKEIILKHRRCELGE